MSTKQKTQRTFLAVTLVTVIAVSTVFMVYAAVLLTLYGTTVTVNEPSLSSVEYNLSNTSNTTWVTNLNAMYNATPWYARINITNTVSQSVTINWVLEEGGGPWTWVDTPVNTTKVLSVGLNTVYATGTGVFTGNYNWGTNTTTAGSYRVKAIVNG